MNLQGERRLVRTADAARVLGIDPSTLTRWARGGLVTPVLITVGGQRRWDVDDLRAQLARLADQESDDDPPVSSS